MVDAEVTRDRETTASRRFYVSSAHLTPEAFAKAVLAHGSIENGLHWVPDMAFLARAPG